MLGFRSAKQQANPPTSGKSCFGPTEQVFIFSKCPGCNEVERRNARRDVFHTAANDRNACHLDCPQDLAQESRLFGDCLDEREMHGRTHHTDRYAWKARPRSDVGDPTVVNPGHARGKEALAKMDAKDFFRINYCG